MTDLNTSRILYYDAFNRRVVNPYESGSLITLFDHQTTVGLVSNVITFLDYYAFNRIVMYCEGHGTVSAGTVILQQSHDANFPGAWVTLITTSMSSASNRCVRNTADRFRGNVVAVRAVITAAITGGGSMSCFIAASNGR